MTDLTTTNGRKAELDRLAEALGTSRPSRLLSAMGLPGFGETFAAEALARWTETGESLHSLTLGRRS